MPYITVRQTPRTHQMSWEDIVMGRAPLFDAYTRDNTGDTTTIFAPRVSDKYLRAVQVPDLIHTLEVFASANAALYEKDRHALYHTYYIPKRSGGRRRIDEPLPDLMNALRLLKTLFEEKFCALHHTSAFAYVKGRSTLDAVKRHQQNTSRWFLKTDFSNFFGSTTPEFLLSMLARIFPFSEVCASERGRQALEKALDLCFLDGGLPQGTPISPLLTNLAMIPIDHRLYNELRKEHFVYTRYADDILISHRYAFDHQAMVTRVDAVLHEFSAPFRIKPEKTRYGSSSGRNWNLGVMLTKDNKITIGRKKKEQLKGMCFNYIRDRQSGNRWELSDVRYMSGLMSYYRMVEPDYMNKFVSWFNQKNNVNLMRMIRADLNS